MSIDTTGYHIEKEAPHKWLIDYKGDPFAFLNKRGTIRYFRSYKKALAHLQAHLAYMRELDAQSKPPTD